MKTFNADEEECLREAASIVGKCLGGMSLNHVSKPELASLTWRFVINHLTEKTWVFSTTQKQKKANTNANRNIINSQKLSTTPHSTTPHSTTPHSTTPHSTTPHSTTPHSTTPHSTTPHSTTPHSTTPHSTTPHSTTPHSTTPHSITPHSTTPHSTTPHSTTPHSTTLHSTAPHSTTLNCTVPGSITPYTTTKQPLHDPLNIKNLLLNHLFHQAPLPVLVREVFDVRLLAFLVNSKVPGLFEDWLTWKEEERYVNTEVSVTAAQRHFSVVPLFECEEMASWCLCQEALVVFLLQFVTASPLPYLAKAKNLSADDSTNHVERVVTVDVYLPNHQMTGGRKSPVKNIEKRNKVHITIKDSTEKYLDYEVEITSLDNAVISFTPEHAGLHVVEASYGVERGESGSSVAEAGMEWVSLVNSPLHVEALEAFDVASIQPLYTPPTDSLSSLAVKYLFPISSLDPKLFSYYVDGSQEVAESWIKVSEKNEKNNKDENRFEIKKIKILDKTRIFGMEMMSGEDENDEVSGKFVEIGYSPGKKGVYKLYVFYGRYQLQGSPFTKKILFNEIKNDGDDYKGDEGDNNNDYGDDDEDDDDDGKNKVENDKDGAKDSYDEDAKVNDDTTKTRTGREVQGKGVRYAFAGHWSSFQVAHITGTNRRPPSTISVNISGPSEAKVKTSENSQGFDVSYLVNEEGRYMLSVKLANKHLAASPYFVQVRPLKVVYQLLVECSWKHDEDLHKLAVSLYGVLERKNFSFNDLLLIKKDERRVERRNTKTNKDWVKEGSVRYLVVVENLGDIEKMRLQLVGRLSETCIGVAEASLTCVQSARVWIFNFNHHLDKHSSYQDRRPAALSLVA